MESDQPNTENEEPKSQLHYTGPPSEGVKISAIEAAIAAGMAPSTSRSASDETAGIQSGTVLPDWTDPPTGAVPKILLTDEDYGEGDEKMRSPIWRERGQDWNREHDFNLNFMQDDKDDPFVADGTRSMASMPDDIDFDDIDLLSISQSDLDYALTENDKFDLTLVQDDFDNLKIADGDIWDEAARGNGDPSSYHAPVHFDYVEDDEQVGSDNLEAQTFLSKPDDEIPDKIEGPKGEWEDTRSLDEISDNPFDAPITPADDPFVKLEEDFSPLARLRKRKNAKLSPTKSVSTSSVQSKALENLEPKHSVDRQTKAAPIPGGSPKKVQSAASEKKPITLEKRSATTGSKNSSSQENPEPSSPKRNPVIATLTGLTMAAIAIGCFFLGPQVCLVLIILLAVLASGELLRNIKQAGHHPASVLALIAVIALVAGAYFRQLEALVLVLALVAVFGLVFYMFSSPGERPAVDLGLTLLVVAWVGGLASFGALLLAPASFPHRTGVAFFASAIILAAANDVGAYVVGAAFGKHPLSPRISPKKSVEGFIGGTVLTVVFAILVVAHTHPLDMGKALVFALLVVFLAPLGDLAESLIKRDLKVKDMGSILPAHGGILDRVDGILFVLPAIYYLVEAFHLV